MVLMDASGFSVFQAMVSGPQEGTGPPEAKVAAIFLLPFLLY
jgi:hypothetical protein